MDSRSIAEPGDKALSVTSRFEWFDFDQEELRRVREVISASVEDAVDPLRLGTFRDSMSNRLFPGASTQHTRLRYVVMIPALLQSRPWLRTDGEVRTRERALNLALAGPQNHRETGVIGRVNPSRRLVPGYWSALRRWGIFEVDHARRDTVQDALNGAAAARSPSADEDGNVFTGSPFRWHRSLAPLVEAFLEKGKIPAAPSIHCTPTEQAFIREQWGSLTPGGQATVLAAMADNRFQARSGELFDQRLPAGDQFVTAKEDLRKAQQTSLVAWSLQIAYNLALLVAAKKAESEGKDALWVRRHADLAKTEAAVQRAYASWRKEVSREGGRLEGWADRAAWLELVPAGPTSLGTIEMLAETAKRLAHNDQDLSSPKWAAVASTRELSAKPSPRLASPAALAGWPGTPEMLARMDFRWSAMSRLVTDLAHDD